LTQGSVILAAAMHLAEAFADDWSGQAECLDYRN
jgi:hypothetical protein